MNEKLGNYEGLMSVDYVQWPVPEMAVSGNVGPQSPLNRNLERLFEEAQISGELKISSRRLREFPKIAAKYNLSDTVFGGKGLSLSISLYSDVINYVQLILLEFHFCSGRYFVLICVASVTCHTYKNESDIVSLVCSPCSC